ncbi:hypothetical protein NIES4075_41380 [Tolypothrix sp. NIES-4075]|uniref:DUF2996 domain-containing protein n=1 Tax=Tolypothrix sp. NIES-4075 TaxID=2005459 RepID=UPI000B5CA09F|nr:DUF2996 domain-containing protein [Tolypothrix sp. NIES-4075]GAX43126.1 hypothetical protein NIES4075_41380 [Tolypothrix sp. NIES-4075]
MAEETNHNQAGEVAPSTVDKQAPDVAEEHAPSTDSTEATDIPTANAPDPEAANPEVNPNAAKAKKPAAPKGEKPAAKEKAEGKPAAAKATKEGAEDKPAAAKAAKKEKPPALEDKPFVEFVEQYYLPALQKAIAQQGGQDVQLSFAKQKLSIVGFDTSEECWQVMGKLQNGLRQFNVYFLDEDIQGKKGFSCNEGKKPSTLESFLIDERKMTLDLMVYGLVQRLNGQKWLGRN